MRIALIECSTEEVKAVAARLSGECSVVEPGPVASPAFDIAIIGSAAIVDGTLCANVRRQVQTPLVVILPAASDFATFDPQIAAVAMNAMDRLPLVVDRELRAAATDHASPSRAALAEREQQLSFAQELARLGSWEWDYGADRVSASPELTALFDLEGRDTTVEEWLAMIVPEDVPALKDALRALADDDTPLDARFRVRRNGRTFSLHTRARRAAGATAEQCRVIGVTQDVTTEMLAQRALHESEARYRSLVEQARDIIVSFDGEGRVRSLNRAFEELTGWSREEWIGEPFFRALDPSSAALAGEQFGTLLAGGEFEQATQFLLRRRDGTTFTVEAFGRGVVSGGEVVEVVVVARDVTARNEDEARAEREKRLASLGQLATSVAHEFNNVLMSIMPFAELVQRRIPDDERVMKATTHILDAIRRGREISREILRFARPAAPSIEPIIASEWMDTIRESVEAILGPLFDVTVDLPEEEVAFAGDRSMLEQAAANLTLNARDAMPEGGRLQLAVRMEGDRVAIDFIDEGKGVEPELHERIFEPLYTTKRAGNGLGLTITHQSMLQQNGSISVHSAPGSGATFTLMLPRVEVPQRAPLPAAASSRRVLVVEDDESVGEGLRLLLEDEGFEVRLVTRGLEAIPAAETFEPDLVLLDVNLPDISGIEVYERLYARWPSLPVIFSTGHADARALAGLQERRVPSIMKPYTAEELMAVIRKAAP